MKRLRWPGLAIRSMVWIVVSGKTMLMRLLMEIRVNDFTYIIYTTSVYVKSDQGVSRPHFRLNLEDLTSSLGSISRCRPTVFLLSMRAALVEMA
jgi:hypothetical protein